MPRPTDRKQDEAERQPAADGGGGRPGSLLPLCAVVGVLLLGALLQAAPRSESEEEEQQPPRAPVRPTAAVREPTVAPLVPLAPPPAPAAPAGGGLVERSRADHARLAERPSDFTLQLGLWCEREPLETLLARHGAQTSLYVLAAPDRGDSCFRVCWGHYATVELARAAAVPTTLREEGAFAQPIGQVLR